MADQHEDQEHAQHEDDLQSFGTEENVWHEEQPPVDGFEDHDLGEHADSLGEASVETEEGEIEESEETEAPPQKKGMWIPLVAAVAGVLFVGTMMYIQFSSGSGSPSAAIPVADVMGSMEAPSVAQNSAATSNFVSPTMDALNAPTNNAPNTGMAIPSIDNGSVSEPLTTAASLVPPAPAPVAPAAPAKAAQPAPVAPVAVPQPKADVVANDAAVASLTVRIDALQKALDQTTQQLNQITSAMTNLQAAAAQPMGAAPAADPALTERLAKIEQQLAAKTTTSAPAKASVVIDDTVAAAAAYEEKPSFVDSKATKAESKKAAHKETAKKKTAKAHKVASTESTKSSKTKSAWVLRAATPDTAWVSKSADSSELRQVEVGQALPGIGIVKAIRQSGGQWEIVGTKGSLQ